MESIPSYTRNSVKQGNQWVPATDTTVAVISYYMLNIFNKVNILK